MTIWGKNMNKKILLGSIIAVVILVLVSFTGVVGYQTTKSSTIAKTSPLFSVRSSRAIDEERKEFTCDYVGKGEENFLSIPKWNDTTIEMQKAIEIISKMEGKLFNKFIVLVIKQMQKDNRKTDKNAHEIIRALKQLRSKSNIDLVKKHIDKEKEYTIVPENTCGYDLAVYNWIPGAFLVAIMTAIMVIIIAMGFMIFTLLVSCIFNCGTLYCHPGGTAYTVGCRV